MFRRKNKKAEQQKLPDLEEATPKVRGRKYEISKLPRTQVVSTTSVKNPVEIDLPDPYNPTNKYGVDDRLLAYFYTKTQIDEMDFGDAPDNSELIEGLIVAIADLEKRTKALEENQIGYGSQISNLEKHSHDYDGDIIENDLPF
tara:strand:- start:53 stop:484 length:432 start_codon:yes stop_codon:yes gene_type:complete